MKTGWMFLVLCSMNVRAFSQEFIFYSSRWSDLTNRSTSRTASVIYMDSGRLTIEQGNSRLYLDVLSKSRNENVFIYSVINFNDETCQAIFSPEQMTFDYLASGFRMRYFIDSIQRPAAEEAIVQEEPEAVLSDSLETDSLDAVEETDDQIYSHADVPPEFPGGLEAMKTWLAANIKYPAAAKRDQIIGQVELSAVVERNGSLSDILIKRDIGGGCGQEAARAVKTMPSWVPGQIRGEDKRVRVTIKVFFPPP